MEQNWKCSIRFKEPGNLETGTSHSFHPETGLSYRTDFVNSEKYINQHCLNKAQPGMLQCCLDKSKGTYALVVSP